MWYVERGMHHLVSSIRARPCIAIEGEGARVPEAHKQSDSDVGAIGMSHHVIPEGLDGKHVFAQRSIRRGCVYPICKVMMHACTRGAEREMNEAAARPAAVLTSRMVCIALRARA